MSTPPLAFTVRNSTLLWRAFTLPLLLFVCAASLSCQERTAEKHTVVDELGRELVLAQPPERVVSLAPSVTEMIYAAGAGHTLVGVSTADDYPPSVDTLPRFSSHPLNVEAVIDLEPDLIIGAEQVNAVRDTDVFQAADIPSFFLASRSANDIMQGIRTLGSMLATEDEAEQMASSLERQLAALQVATDTLSHHPSVLFLAGDETLYAFGSDSYVHDLITMAGGESITADLEVRAPTLSDEFVLNAQPEVIIGSFGEEYDPARLRRLHPTWQEIPAVVNERVYSLDPSIIVRPGPRIVEGAWRMAEMLHDLHPDTTVSEIAP